MKDEKLTKIIAAQIKTYRTKKGLLQVELGKKARIPQPVISSYEKGKRCPGLMHLFRISEVLSVSLDVLCGKTKEINSADPVAIELLSLLKEFEREPDWETLTNGE